MNCPLNVGEKVDFSGTCWCLAEKNQVGSEWICILRNDSGETIPADCSQVTPCIHQAGTMPVAINLRTARRPSRSAIEVSHVSRSLRLRKKGRAGVLDACRFFGT